MNVGKKPHKHAEVIKAWADGAEIQVKFKEDGEWVDVRCDISWSENYHYRVKPPRVFQKSSLSDADLTRILTVNRGFCESVTMARIVADAAIKQHIIDLEKEAANGV